jgi:L-amino acid N-acyltransferase YncA
MGEASRQKKPSKQASVLKRPSKLPDNGHRILLEAAKAKRAGVKKIEYVIDRMEAGDWTAVRSIYLEGIQTGQATFETQAPAWESWDASHLSQCRLVARSGGKVAGWAALGPVSSRRVYAGVAETSIYVAESSRGLGIGLALLGALINCSEQHGIWTLQAGILPENESSLALHKRCGFREVGRRERIGKLGQTWRDVILLERRSKVAGLE